MSEVYEPSPSSSSPKIANSRQSFVEYVQTRRSQPPLGRVIDRMRTLINAGRAPTSITCWFELFRWLDRERLPRDDIGLARQLWQEYQKRSSAHV
jgi:hypothetical protein